MQPCDFRIARQSAGMERDTTPSQSLHVRHRPMSPHFRSTGTRLFELISGVSMGLEAFAPRKGTASAAAAAHSTTPSSASPARTFRCIIAGTSNRQAKS